MRACVRARFLRILAFVRADPIRSAWTAGCQARGLTGDQGVLIPQSNVRNLMLRKPVIDAVEAGKFHIYPVESVAQGIELLTGVAAGEMDENGEYPKETVNNAVQERLRRFAERWFSFHLETGTAHTGTAKRAKKK